MDRIVGTHEVSISPSRSVQTVISVTVWVPEAASRSTLYTRTLSFPYLAAVRVAMALVLCKVESENMRLRYFLGTYGEFQLWSRWIRFFMSMKVSGRRQAE